MFPFDPSDPDHDYERVEMPGDYCEAWPLLPWQQIRVCNGFMTPHVLHCVGQATHITELDLGCHKQSPATVDGLADALRQLKLLCSLDVEWPGPELWEALVTPHRRAAVRATTLAAPLLCQLCRPALRQWPA